MQSSFTDFSVLLGIAVIVVIAIKILRQPPIGVETKDESKIFVFGFKDYMLWESPIPAGKKFIIVDKDPSVIDLLERKGIPSQHGDISDAEFLNELNLDNAELILSNIKSKAINIQFITHARVMGFDGPIAINTANKEDVKELYKAGADYVEVPIEAGIKEAVSLIEKFGTNKSNYRKIRKTHMKKIKRTLPAIVYTPHVTNLEIHSNESIYNGAFLISESVNHLASCVSFL